LQVPDDAVKITDDTLTVSLTNANVVDQFTFPYGAGNNLGFAGSPAKLSFSITYTKTGEPRQVRPTSIDPLSPFTWGGEMWMATNSGTFSLTYDDGTFSAQGSFDSAGNFGEMGRERNGVFVEDAVGTGQVLSAPVPHPIVASVTQPTGSTAAAPQGVAANVPKLKGKIPLTELAH
jgi:hypothetical protein